MANVKSIKDVQDENDDDKRQAYYAGGQGQNGGGSGQEVLDPREFMKRAREEMGAQTVDQWREGQGPAPSSSFTGSGQTLNGATAEGAPAPKPPEEHTITFYQNGFTVDDGPLRSADDPANAAFLAAINRGQMPAELMGPDGMTEGDVHIIDKSGEAYTPPPVTLKPFSGEGRSMREEASASGAGPSSADAVVPQELVVDATAPTTSIQVRMPDGSRKIVKANHTHTVLQLRQHIAFLCAPGLTFTLLSGFPPKPIDKDGADTLEAAKLLGESLVVKA